MLYVLLMVWSTASYQGGVGVVQQEFSSLANCEKARTAMLVAHNGTSTVLMAHGCFKK